MPWYDTLAQNLVLFFAEGKFYTIFAFLFGLGFAVQLARADAKGKDIRSFYPRRLLVLFGFGVLHSILFWTGDILRLYAVLGFALLAFRKRSNRTLLIWAGALFALSFVILGFLGAPGGKETAIPGFDIVGMAHAAYTSSSYLDVLGFQTLASPLSFLILLVIQGPSVMALFLLGLIIGRLHFFERLPEHRPVLRRVLWIGLVVGLIGNSLFVFAENDWLASLGFTDRRAGVGRVLRRRVVAALAARSRRTAAGAPGPGGAHGAEQLRAAIGDLCDSVWRLWAWAIRGGGRGGAAGPDLPHLPGADPVQRLVAEPLPVWADRVALALADLRQAPAVARVATSSSVGRRQGRFPPGESSRERRPTTIIPSFFRQNINIPETTHMVEIAKASHAPRFAACSSATATSTRT